MSIQRTLLKTGRMTFILLAGCAACLSFGTAMAADNITLEEARAQLERDREACRNNTETRDLNACLREAGATFEKNRQKARGGHSSAALINQNFDTNRLQRCQRFTGEERNMCEQRILNGPVEGSVKSGGVLYRATTTVN